MGLDLKRTGTQLPQEKIVTRRYLGNVDGMPTSKKSEIWAERATLYLQDLVDPSPTPKDKRPSEIIPAPAAPRVDISHVSYLPIYRAAGLEI